MSRLDYTFYIQYLFIYIMYIYIYMWWFEHEPSLLSGVQQLTEPRAPSPRRFIQSRERNSTPDKPSRHPYNLPANQRINFQGFGFNTGSEFFLSKFLKIKFLKSDFFTTKNFKYQISKIKF